MTVLADASVILKWYVQEPGSDVARRIRAKHPVWAPDLIIAEVLNAVWTFQRVGRLSPAQAQAIAGSARGMLDRLWPIRPLAIRAMIMAQTLDHPVYDCFYLALAEATGQPLVTADRRFLRKADNSLWRSLVRDLYGFSP